MTIKGRHTGKRGAKSRGSSSTRISRGTQRGASRAASETRLRSPSPRSSSASTETRPKDEAALLPSWELLSAQAAKNLALRRRELEAELESRYMDLKWAEVKRLAEEIANQQRVLGVVDVTAEELASFKVKQP